MRFQIYLRWRLDVIFMFADDPESKAMVGIFESPTGTGISLLHVVALLEIESNA